MGASYRVVGMVPSRGGDGNFLTTVYDYYQQWREMSREPNWDLDRRSGSLSLLARLSSIVPVFESGLDYSSEWVRHFRTT